MDKSIINLQKLQNTNNAKIPTIIGKKQASFKVNIRRFITDVDGKIKDKDTLPDFAKQSFPVWVFGNFDKDGGYFLGQKLQPVKQGLFYLHTATVGKDLNLLNYSGTNNIKQHLKTGDQVFLFSDSTEFPSFFVWIVLQGGTRSYASILSNPLNVGIDTFMMKYFADNSRQFIETLTYVNIDELGNYTTYPIPPSRYKTTSYQLDNFIDIIAPYKINNFSGIYFYMDFSCDNIQLIFRYLKK